MSREKKVVLTVAEWNVRGEKSKECQTYVADRLQELQWKIEKESEEIKAPDIIVLTEYVESKNYDKDIETKLENAGYTLFRQDKEIRGNAILIAAKSDIIEVEDEPAVHCLVKEGEKVIPDCMFVFMKLKVKSNKNSYPFTVVGYRTITAGDWKDRYMQLQNAYGELKKEYEKMQNNGVEEEYLKRIIWVGDFNNGIIHEEENIEYNDYKSKNYNYQKIKKFFANKFNVNVNDFMTTPKGEVEEVYSFKNRYKYKLDHIFTKGFRCVSAEYDWSWRNKENIPNMDSNRKRKGYDPDHAILKAVLELPL